MNVCLHLDLFIWGRCFYLSDFSFVSSFVMDWDWNLQTGQQAGLDMHLFSG